MADRNYFKTNDGALALPVNTDGEFLTDLINTEEGSLCDVYIEFYEDEQLQTPVTPTGGVISAQGSPMGNVFLPSPTSTTINAADVSVPNASYTPIVFDGLVIKAKISVSGITGANYMKAVLFNY